LLQVDPQFTTEEHVKLQVFVEKNSKTILKAIDVAMRGRNSNTKRASPAEVGEVFVAPNQIS